MNENLEALGIEFVRELNGIKYYNDSMGNNPSQTIEALKSFDQRVILIAGGYDEKVSYEPLGDAMVEKAKHLILMGQASAQIEMALMRKLVGKYRGIDIRITHCNTLRQAVDCAFLSAKPGDIVLLSPAGSGLDMFKDFEELGNRFKEYVHAL